MKRSIEIEIKKSDPRTHDAIITYISHESYGWYSDPSEEIVKQESKVLVKNWFEKPEWHQTRLKSIEKLDTGKWHVVIEEAYLD